MRPVTRWGFLGIGRVTERMVAAVRQRPNHQIAMAAGRDRDKVRAWAAKHSVENTTTRFLDVLESTDIDIVYVALPPSLHCEWTELALQHGKRVLCEKPMGTRREETDRMARCAEDTNTPLSHATAFVHHPRSHAMRAVIRSGEIGEVRRVTIACSFASVAERLHDHRMNSEAGGGCLLDLGWYCSYATLWFTGLHPTEMKSIGTRWDPAGNGATWKQVQTIARLDSGAIASWDCGYDAAGRKWMEIAGTQGSVICDDFLRPWDTAKPRFWVHGHDGKARCETVGEGVFQEAFMLDHAAYAPMLAAREGLAFAMETQRRLEEIDRSLREELT